MDLEQVRGVLADLAALRDAALAALRELDQAAATLADAAAEGFPEELGMHRKLDGSYHLTGALAVLLAAEYMNGDERPLPGDRAGG